MQFTTSIAAIVSLLAVAANATPTPQPQKPEIVTRANAKLNQYSNDDCKDNQGGNVPTYHASPAARKCYDIDSSSLSFYFGLGPLSQTWGGSTEGPVTITFSTLTSLQAYSEGGCHGQSVNLGGKGGCQAVEANFSDAFGTIRSVMMD